LKAGGPKKRNSNKKNSTEGKGAVNSIGLVPFRKYEEFTRQKERIIPMGRRPKIYVRVALRPDRSKHEEDR